MQEFLVTSLYHSEPPRYAEVRALVVGMFDDQAKNLGGLSKELVDTGIRSAIACGKIDDAVMLARSTKTHVGDPAGITHTSGTALPLVSLSPHLTLS
jgi:hypothetical protein